MPAAKRICEVIRGLRPEGGIILGGPHATLVNAASKRERLLRKPGRAMKAFAQLDELCDVVVAGDGEEAVFLALRDDAPRLVDADDPKSSLFLTSKRLGEL